MIFVGLKKMKKHWLRDIISTLLSLLTATILSWLLFYKLQIKNDTPLIYLLAVMIVSIVTTGYIYGIFASITSVFCTSFLFPYPIISSFYTRFGFPITFACMLIASLITCTLTARMNQQTNLAMNKEKRTEQIYMIAKKLLVTQTKERIIYLTANFISDTFDCSVIFYRTETKAEPPYCVCQSEEYKKLFQCAKDHKAVQMAIQNRVKTGNTTAIVKDANGFYIPFVLQEKVIAVIGLYKKGPMFADPGNESFLDTIIATSALAMERQMIADERQKALIESEKEKMRGNLLRAVSHDLRTPLTSILGASSAILENKSTLDQNTYEKLIYDIQEDSKWLIRMVENLLLVTKIKNTGTTLKKSAEAAEEVVSSAVMRVHKHFPDQYIHVKVPDELLMIPMNAILIEQVIINLLENAIKHSSKRDSIELIVEKNQDTAEFKIKDFGSGIDPQVLPEIFDETAVSNYSRGLRGFGIGLSICKTIINAHNGTIKAKNRKDRGAVFSFTLPLCGGENDE